MAKLEFKDPTRKPPFKIVAGLFAIMAFTLAFGRSSFADDKLYIKMGEAKAYKPWLSFPQPNLTGGTSPAVKVVQSDLYKIIYNDLFVSGYFRFFSETDATKAEALKGLKPKSGDEGGFNFEAWREPAKADLLLRSGFSFSGDSITLETYVYDVTQGTLIAGKKYKGTRASLRRMAHTFCNDMLEALTGKPGMFLSSIAVVSDREDGQHKELYIMDWDGNHIEKVTAHHSVVLSPAWSTDGNKVAYTAIVKRVRTKTENWDMFLLDLVSGQRTLLSYRQGLNSGAAFAPDNSSLYVTLSQKGNPDIYRIGLDGEVKSRLTAGPTGAMNVEPSISSDGKHIVFSSDRSGVPMIYSMDADGGNVKRLTWVGKYNASPCWSPDGKRIAFSGWTEDHFDIFTMNADGSDLIRITSAKKKSGKWSQNEDPSYSPDGRMIMYTSDRLGVHQIYISNLDGSEEHRITADSANYFKPRWSVNRE